MACLAVFTDGVWGTGEALRVRTLQVLGVGRRSQHLAQIYISHHCSLSFGINYVPGTLWGEGGGALLLCDSRCKGLYVHHRFIAFLDQNSFSHSALLSKSSLGTWAFIHLGHWILLSTPSVRGGGELPPLSMRGGNLEK